MTDENKVEKWWLCAAFAPGNSFAVSRCNAVEPADERPTWWPAPLQDHCAQNSFPFVFLDQDHLSFKTTLWLVVLSGIPLYSTHFSVDVCFASGLVISLFLVFAGPVIVCHKECTWDWARDERGQPEQICRVSWATQWSQPVSTHLAFFCVCLCACVCVCTCVCAGVCDEFSG